MICKAAEEAFRKNLQGEFMQGRFWGRICKHVEETVQKIVGWFIYFRGALAMREFRERFATQASGRIYNETCREECPK